MGHPCSQEAVELRNCCCFCHTTTLDPMRSKYLCNCACKKSPSPYLPSTSPAPSFLPGFMPAGFPAESLASRGRLASVESGKCSLQPAVSKIQESTRGRSRSRLMKPVCRNGRAILQGPDQLCIVYGISITFPVFIYLPPTVIPMTHRVTILPKLICNIIILKFALLIHVCLNRQ